MGILNFLWLGVFLITIVGLWWWGIGSLNWLSAGEDVRLARQLTDDDLFDQNPSMALYLAVASDDLKVNRRISKAGFVLVCAGFFTAVALFFYQLLGAWLS